MQHSKRHFPTEYIRKCNWYQPDVVFFLFSVKKELQKSNYCIFASVRIIAVFVTVALQISEV